MADIVPKNEELTAQTVAEIVKAAMPAIREAAGEAVGQAVRDSWEKSLEGVAKTQEQARATNTPVAELHAAGRNAIGAVVTGEERSTDGESRAGVFFWALCQAKGDLERASAIAKADPRYNKATERTFEKVLDRTKSVSQASNFSDAGVLIPEEYSGRIVELLENLTVVRRRAGTPLTLRRGSLNMGKQNQRATAFYIDEAEDLKISGHKYSDLRLDLKKLTALQVVTNDLLRFADNVDARIIRDLATAIAQKEDATLLRSNGTEKRPKGLLHWITDDHKIDPVEDLGGGIDNILATLVTMVALVKKKNLPVSSQNSSFIFNTDVWRSLYMRQTNGIHFFKAEMDAGRILGYQFDETNQVPDNVGDDGQSTEIYFQYWPAIELGVGPEIALDVSKDASYIDETGSLVSAWSRDQQAFRMIQYHDMISTYDFAGSVCENVPKLWLAETSG
jgi:HK97 family phage major capsid protein